jgi:hypothetical protein
MQPLSALIKANYAQSKMDVYEKVRLMVQVSKRGWLLGLLCVFLVAGFHINSIQSRYMRDDEEIAFRTTNRELSYTVWYQATPGCSCSSMVFLFLDLAAVYW